MGKKKNHQQNMLLQKKLSTTPAEVTVTALELINVLELHILRLLLYHTYNDIIIYF